MIASRETDVDVLALDDALQTLTKIDPRQGRVVELRFFAGLSWWRKFPWCWMLARRRCKARLDGRPAPGFIGRCLERARYEAAESVGVQNSGRRRSRFWRKRCVWRQSSAGPIWIRRVDRIMDCAPKWNR